MKNPCVIPAIPNLGADEWLQLHERYVNFSKNEDPDLVLIGASIIQTIQCFPIWTDKFIPLKSLNLGVCGDLTENLLWRIKNGVLDHIKPKVCILNIGSNNLFYDNTPTHIAEGILAIVDEIKLKLPYCHIIVLAILPLGPLPGRLRTLGDKVNKVLKTKIKEMTKVELYKAKNFLQPDGSLSHDDASDYIHPSELGYRKIFDPLFERIEYLLKN